MMPGDASSQLAAVENLLLRLFDDGPQLVRFLARTQGVAFVRELPAPNVSLAELAHACARSLTRSGLVDEHLFAALAIERPTRAELIHAVARDVGVRDYRITETGLKDTTRRVRRSVPWAIAAGVAGAIAAAAVVMHLESGKRDVELSVRRNLAASAPPYAISEDASRFVVDALCAGRVPRPYIVDEAENLDDDSVIRLLVRDEGDAVEVEDLTWHLSLFDPHVVFYDRLSSRLSTGCAELAERDEALFKTIRFLQISEVVERITTSPTRASATSIHTEQTLRTPKESLDLLPGPATATFTMKLDWTFVKSGGYWRIFSIVPFEDREGQPGSNTAKPGTQPIP